jgi:hypothetical protein
MRRDELEVGGRYAGPGSRCYEILDLTPGWRTNHAGEWVEDLSTRTRHMPGKGDVTYRSNLSLKAYAFDESGQALGRCAVDPRKLTEPWAQHEQKRTTDELEQVHATRLLTLLRRNLRGYPGHKPEPQSAYTVSPDGRTVSLPAKDLSELMDMAFRDRKS